MVQRWLHGLEAINQSLGESGAAPINVPFSYEPKAREHTLYDKY